MKKLFSANRVAAVAAWATGLAAFITGVLQTLPVSWQNYALSAVGVLSQVPVVLKFLQGSQQWDKLTVGQGQAAAIAAQDLLAYHAQTKQAQALNEPLAIYKQDTLSPDELPAPNPDYNPVSALAPEETP